MKTLSVLVKAISIPHEAMVDGGEEEPFFFFFLQNLTLLQPFLERAHRGDHYLASHLGLSANAGDSAH